MKRFTSLPCYQQLREKLSLGESPAEVAKWLHEQGFCTDLKLESLRVTLYRFVRKEIRYSGRLTKQQKNILSEAKDIVDSVRDNYVDPQDVFNMLALFQVERVLNSEKLSGETEVQFERRIQKEITLLRQTLRDFGDLMVDRNLRYFRKSPDQKNAPKDVLDSVFEKYGERAKGLQDPKSRRKVLNVLEALQSRAEGPVAQLLQKTKDRLIPNDVIDVGSDGSFDSQDSGNEL